MYRALLHPLTLLLCFYKLFGGFPYTFTRERRRAGSEEEGRGIGSGGSGDKTSGNGDGEPHLRLSKIAFVWSVLLGCLVPTMCLVVLMRDDMDTSDTRKTLNSIVLVSLCLVLAFIQPYTALRHRVLFKMVRKMLSEGLLPNITRGGGEGAPGEVMRGMCGVVWPGMWSVWRDFSPWCLVSVSDFAISLFVTVHFIWHRDAIGKFIASPIIIIIISSIFPLTACLSTYTLTHAVCRTLTHYIKDHFHPLVTAYSIPPKTDKGGFRKLPQPHVVFPAKSSAAGRFSQREREATPEPRRCWDSTRIVHQCVQTPTMRYNGMIDQLDDKRSSLYPITDLNPPHDAKNKWNDDKQTSRSNTPHARNNTKWKENKQHLQLHLDTPPKPTVRAAKWKALTHAVEVSDEVVEELMRYQGPVVALVAMQLLLGLTMMLYTWLAGQRLILPYLQSFLLTARLVCVLCAPDVLRDQVCVGVKVCVCDWLVLHV